VISLVSQKILLKTETRKEDRIDDDLWINPGGGFGEMLMLSGVLKIAWDKNPQRRYNLVKRTAFNSFFSKHPAINKIGSPPVDAKVMGIAGGAPDVSGGPERRPFQVLAQQFGLSIPVEEKLYFPGELHDDDILNRFIDWGTKKIAVIAPASDSPRKTAHPLHWHYLVEKLINQGIFVIQVGSLNDIYIKGAYSLLGLLTNEQLVMLIKKSRVVIAVDNFIIHISYMVQTPAVVLWGPTDPDIYGYGNQVNLSGPPDHCRLKNECLGKNYPKNFPTTCPLNAEHCMNKIPVDFVLYSVINLLKG
jgi:hypothetical protein